MSDSEALDSEHQYCLRWKYHHTNLQSMFSELLEHESFCDVTLACEGKTIRAHKLMLSASSPYFYTLFSKHEENDPIVILKDVKYNDIKTLVDFMYKGEINVENSQLNSLLQTAKELQIKCLAAVSWLYEDGSLRRIETNQTLTSSANRTITVDRQDSGGKKRKAEPDKEGPNIPTKAPCVVKEEPPSEGYLGKMTDRTQEKTNDKKSNDRTSLKPQDGLSETEEGNIPVSSNSNKQIMPRPEVDGNLSIDENSSSHSSAKKSCTNGSMKRFKEVVTMTTYVQQGGKRPNFWEIPTTRQVMEAIKNKEMEMKKAAELLGVSYGTLYGRYRDCYGYLKHPYRVREFWLEPDSINIINQITRKEISLFKGAELLNVSATSLANYLATLSQEHEGGSEEDDLSSDDHLHPPQIKEERPDYEEEPMEVLNPDSKTTQPKDYFPSTLRTTASLRCPKYMLNM